MPFMGQPDYRVYEMNRRLQQWTEVCDSHHVNLKVFGAMQHFATV